MEYRDYNDYELLSYITDSNEEANNIMIEKYQPLIHSISNKMFKFTKNTSLELNDLIQEGNIGLTYAINTFEEQKEACFYTYAKTCIERKMISTIISSKRKKHQILNDSVSYDQFEDPSYNFLKDNFSDPLKVLINSSEEQRLEDKIKCKLTSLEKQVFELMITGIGYKEIALILNKNIKAIDNAIQRIRNKARMVINVK